MSQYSSCFHTFASGGDEEIRTLDPLLAGQVLSQLSYTPKGYLILSDSENRTTMSENLLPKLFLVLLRCE